MSQLLKLWLLKTNLFVHVCIYIYITENNNIQCSTSTNKTWHNMYTHKQPEHKNAESPATWQAASTTYHPKIALTRNVDAIQAGVSGTHQVQAPSKDVLEPCSSGDSLHERTAMLKDLQVGHNVHTQLKTIAMLRDLQVFCWYVYSTATIYTFYAFIHNYAMTKLYINGIKMSLIMNKKHFILIRFRALNNFKQ